MKSKKALSLMTSTALAAFSLGVVHAADIAQTKNLTGTVLLADGKDAGCGGEGSCGGDMKKDKSKSESAQKEVQSHKKKEKKEVEAEHE